MSAEEWEQQRADSYNLGEGTLNLRDGYSCKLCKNRGNHAVIRADIYGNPMFSLSECKCMKIRRSIHSLERSGLKDVIGKYRFDGFEAEADWQKEIKDKASAFSGSGERLFFIGGQSGCGKTHLCTAICRELILSGKEVRYMLWRDDITKMKSYSDSGEGEELKDRYKRVDVLYIDDMFKTGSVDGQPQKPTTADVNLAFEIINARYLNPKLITIVSSESTIGDIADIDEAVGGRIKELSGKFCVNIRKDRTKNYRLRDLEEL